MQLRPSDIYFSQDSIRNRFRDGCPHSYKTLGETPLSSAGKHLSNTNLSDLSIVVTRDIFVYR